MMMKHRSLLLPRPLPSTGRGFTLIELLVVIAMVSFVMMLAAPNFVEARRNAQLSDAVSQLALAAGTAKSAALKTGRTAYVQVNDTSTGWGSGWFVFVDNNWNQTYDAGDEVLLQKEALVADISATPTASTPFAAGYLLFDANGFPKLKAGGSGQGSMVMAVTGRSTTVIMDTAGRLRSCKTGSAGCSAI